jgi:hypothetical protein
MTQVMKTKSLFLTLVVLFTSLQMANAQKGRYTSYRGYEERDGWSVSLKTGYTQFFGELGDSPKNLAVYGIGVTKGISRNFNLKLDFEAGNLAGEEKQFYKSKFTSDFYQLNLLGIMNIGNMLSEELPFNLSIYAGIGTMGFNSMAYDLADGHLQRYTSIVGDGGHTPVFSKYGNAVSDQNIFYTRERVYPVGLMMSYPIGNRINLGLDFRYNFVRTDKLDATSGVDRSDISKNGGVNKVYGQLTYSDTPNDKWGYAALYLTYKFGSDFRAYQRGI